MKRLMMYLKDYKKESILAPLFKLLEAFFELMVPLVMANIIDYGIFNRNMGYIGKMGLVLLLLSWAAIWYGHTSVLALIVGILVLDLTVQGVHITNQTVIYRVKPEARNRLTAGYMTSYFIGGAAGSLISASAWQHAGWSGVCGIGAIVAALNLLVWWRGYHRQDVIN